MTSACVNQLDASQINGISQPEQLANIPALSFAGFSSNQISKLLPKTCSGFKSDQVVKMNNNYPNYACQGFKSECLSNIPAKAFTGFSSACISLVDALQMSGLLSSQLEQLPDAAYSGFTSKQIAQFTPAACAGISSNQVSKLNNGYPNYACQGFKSDCLSNIPDRSYTGFTSTCVTFLEASQVHGISSFQLKQITPNAFSGFTSQQVSNLDPLSCSGITSSQVSSFNNGFPNHACQGITATCLSSISEASYSGFKSVCLSNIPPESMKGIAASQLRNIPFDQIKGLTQAQVATLNNSTCSGFTASQINKLSSSACSGFKYGCLFEMTPLNIVSSLTSQCFSNIPSASASGFKPESIPYFTTDTLTGLQLNQLVTWFNSYGEKYFVSVATQKQLSAVSSGVILKFKEKIENSEIQRKRQLALAQLSSLTWLQLSLSTDDSLKNVLNANTITDITFDQTFYGLLNNVHMLPEDVFSTLKVQSFSFFLSDTVSGITAEQISHIVPKAFNYPNGLTSNVPSINSSSVKGITDQQLDMLLTDDNLAKLFTCTQFRAMTLSQWNYIRHTNSYRQLESKCGSISPGPSSYPPKENPSRPNPVQPSRSHSRLKELRSSGMSVMKYSNASYFALLLMPIIITALVQ
ncbi:hypothetical protein C9374_001081 [Naegleria lovaniensis]|uniref:Uncharacterized protein n=1 Tax=Naegleria lovaniensis TaxID=51637 RepID=A0AA88GRE8_NAELO|nr:uncharacterized protein C9374_001081 [Naegleria lovaniensis]KAG2387487.1 hypothetical protein C9374_001081 [Naegleria lovaniensis]